MSSLEFETSSFLFHKRSTTSPSQRVETEPTILLHLPHEEEKVLHDFRHRIQHYQNVLPSSKNWEYYKKIVNPYEFVYTQKKYDSFPDSICTLRPLSRSYFKMVEMLDQTAFLKGISSTMGSIKTAHVCEGPGGFIEAIFNEAAREDVAIQVSIAMTLKPRQCTVPGWKRAAQFLKRHRNIKIIYGEDNTGDIMKPENQQYFIEYATHPHYGGKVDLFTADGGFDFSSDYARQEKMVFPLLLASTKIGLEVLKPGGTFVLKIFDFYYNATQDLIYFLSCHFEEWTLYKPAMSRPCNPEHYFIGRGFVGCTDEILDVMRLWCSMMESNESVDSLLRMEYPEEFQGILAEMRTRSFRSQIRYLERVFEMIECQEEQIIHTSLTVNQQTSLEWCQRYHVPISESQTTMMTTMKAVE